jgi:formylglycine-generating enzyme
MEHLGTKDSPPRGAGLPPGAQKAAAPGLFLHCRRLVATAALLLLASPGWCAPGATAAVEDIPMVSLKGGCFRMGDLFNTGGADERPVHEVCLKNFAIGRYPVTQKLWVSVMGSNPSQYRDRDDLPVEQVSWVDAQAFLTELAKRTGKAWRLPTEAEWEYAARSAGREQRYPGTDSVAELGEYAWLEGNSGLRTHPVGTRKPNALGIFDMAGNVWQWVQDRYDRDYYRQSPRLNPKGDPFGANRILKGGSAYQDAFFSRVSYRDYQDPAKRRTCVGFRLALSEE